MLADTERERLLNVAKNYEEHELQLFIAETGWEDWMNEYTEAEDGEPISEWEAAEIDRILEGIFREAHT